MTKITMMHLVVAARKFTNAKEYEIARRLRAAEFEGQKLLPNPIFSRHKNDPYFRRTRRIAGIIDTLAHERRFKGKITVDALLNEIDARLSPTARGIGGAHMDMERKAEF